MWLNLENNIQCSMICSSNLFPITNKQVVIPKVHVLTPHTENSYKQTEYETPTIFFSFLSLFSSSLLDNSSCIVTIKFDLTSRLELLSRHLLK